MNNIVYLIGFKQGFIFVRYNFYDFNEQKFDDQTISSYDHTSLKEGL